MLKLLPLVGPKSKKQAGYKNQKGEQKVKNHTKTQKMLAVLLASTILIAVLSSSAIAAPAGTSENSVIKIAKGWIGVKYVANGNSRSGIDCSHFVYQVYRKAGAVGYTFMKVPTMKKKFTTVSSPHPGDVIFWKKDVKTSARTYWLASHVGIYIGKGQFIHTDIDTRTVKISPIAGVYKTGQPYYARWTRTK